MLIRGSLLALLAKDPRGNSKIQASQSFPQILAADADGAGSLNHLPVVSSELLQQVLSLALLEAIAQGRLFYSQAIGSDTAVAACLLFVEKHVGIQRAARRKDVGALDAVT